MNAVDDAIRNLKYNIPIELLEMSFLNYADVNHRHISLDEKIRSTIIVGRVIRDCSQTEGVMVNIEVDSCNVSLIARGEYIIDVPKKLTQGRTIVDPLSLTTNAFYTNIAGSSTASSSIASYTNKMYNNVTSQNFQQTARLELIGDNVVYVYDPTIIINRSFLRCLVEYDENLTNLHPKVLPVFNRLVVLATQSYIYNKMRINLDKGYIHAGYELSVIRDIVDSYSDAENMYLEFLRINFAVGAYTTQREKLARYVRSLVGNNF